MLAGKRWSRAPVSACASMKSFSEVPMSREYEFQAIESKWQKRWADTRVFEVTEDSSRPSSIACRCCPIRREEFTWAMCAITPSSTSSHDSKE